MRNVVMSVFNKLELRALNTFARTVVGSDNLWTCGTKRKPDKRTQIDYVGTSAMVDGDALPLTIANRCFQRSDHRPVVASLKFHCPVIIPHTEKRSMTGWTPNGESALHSFQEACVSSGFHCLRLDALQDTICGAAFATYIARFSIRARLSALSSPMKMARRRIACASPDSRREAVQAMRKLRRTRIKAANTKRLQQVALSSKRSSTLPLRLEVAGSLTADRQA